MAPWWSPVGRVPEVSAQELHERLMRGEEIHIIDVRTPHEFANGHICGAVNVPIQSFLLGLTDLGLDVSKPVVTICKTAHRSIPATRVRARLEPVEPRTACSFRPAIPRQDDIRVDVAAAVSARDAPRLEAHHGTDAVPDVDRPGRGLVAGVRHCLGQATSRISSRSRRSVIVKSGLQSG